MQQAAARAYLRESGERWIAAHLYPRGTGERNMAGHLRFEGLASGERLGRDTSERNGERPIVAYLHLEEMASDA